jgi:RNase P/RNase MRP subunit p30
MSSLPFFDILKFNLGNPAEYGFSKTFFLDSVHAKVKFAKDESEALSFRNKKVLVKVENYPTSMELIRGFEKKEAVLLLDLSDIVNSKGGKRATFIRRMKKFALLCKKYKVPFGMASFSENEEGMRTESELEHIGFLIGLERGDSRKALNKLSECLSPLKQ